MRMKLVALLAKMPMGTAAQEFEKGLSAAMSGVSQYYHNQGELDGSQFVTSLKSKNYG